VNPRATLDDLAKSKFLNLPGLELRPFSVVQPVGDGLSAPRQNTYLEDHPLLAVRDCSSDILAAILQREVTETRY
jgi:hypothetical protein